MNPDSTVANMDPLSLLRSSGRSRWQRPCRRCNRTYLREHSFRIAKSRNRQLLRRFIPQSDRSWWAVSNPGPRDVTDWREYLNGYSGQTSRRQSSRQFLNTCRTEQRDLSLYCAVEDLNGNEGGLWGRKRVVAKRLVKVIKRHIFMMSIICQRSVSTNFDIFASKPIQSSILATNEAHYSPIAPISHSDLEFVIPAENDTYIDLNAKLYVRGKLARSEGAAATGAAPISTIKNTRASRTISHSLFSQCSVTEWRMHHAVKRPLPVPRVSGDYIDLRQRCIGIASDQFVLVLGPVGVRDDHHQEHGLYREVAEGETKEGSRTVWSRSFRSIQRATTSAAGGKVANLIHQG